MQKKSEQEQYNSIKWKRYYVAEIALEMGFKIKLPRKFNCWLITEKWRGERTYVMRFFLPTSISVVWAKKISPENRCLDNIFKIWISIVIFYCFVEVSRENTYNLFASRKLLFCQKKKNENKRFQSVAILHPEIPTSTNLMEY